MRLIGIDLGSTAIKAVELDSAFGRFEIHEYHEKKLEAGEDPFQALSRFFSGLTKTPERIAISLPSGKVTFRNFQLPSRDKKAIQAAVGFELEDELPFSIENAVYDYTILSQGKQGASVHVAATLRRHMIETLETWTRAGVNPDLVTSEAWAYRTVLNRAVGQQEREKPIALVQIGSDRTTIYVHWKTQPVLARDFSWGGKDLTLAICQKYHIPLDQAETAKLEHGFVLTEVQKKEATAEQVQFSEALLAPLQDLVWNIRQSGLACRNITHEKLGAVYISGGTALLPGLARVLEENLGVPVKLLPALSSLTTSGVDYPQTADAGLLLASALALCLVSSEKTTSINLRKKEFAKAGEAGEFSIASLKRPLIATGIVTLSAVISLVAQSVVYEGRIRDADNDLRRSIKTFFGGGLADSAVKNYLADMKKLKSSIEKEIGKQRETNKLSGPNPHNPIDFLKDISTSIPKDLIVDMTVFQVGAAPASSFSSAEPGTASLTFLFANPQVAEKLASILEGKIGGLQRSKMEEVPPSEGNPKRWKITFSGKPTEESYGK